MKVPLSNRLRACCDLVRPGAKVADIGCDHGYLGISLLVVGKAARIWASDLREKPLEKAKENAARFSVTEQIEFCLGDGLARIPPEEVDTVVIAGMGGDNIAAILERAPWVRREGLDLILQPQSSANDLRRWLGEEGFCIKREKLVLDGGFQYAAMLVHFGGGSPLTPGEQYCSPQLMATGSELLAPYLDRIIAALERTSLGLAKGSESERLHYYTTALRELKEMRETL